MTAPATLWAARVHDSRTWHLTWRVERGVDATFSACGLEVRVGLWKPAIHFLQLSLPERCALCDQMAGPLFARHAEPVLGPTVEIAPGVAMDVSTFSTPPVPEPVEPAGPPELPPEVLIGPYCYTLAVDDEAVAEFGKQREGEFAGFSDHASLRIRVASKDQHGELFAPAVLRAVVLHEFLHAVLQVSAWSPRAMALFEEDFDRDEYLVSSVEPMLLCALVENPRLLAWLTHR